MGSAVAAAGIARLAGNPRNSEVTLKKAINDRIGLAESMRFLDWERVAEAFRR
jgi:hypothetical protein